MSDKPDFVVVGAGPNGLAAGIALAEQGFGVKIVEAQETPGGGTRTGELTLPGFHHDICSAIHPMAATSPFLNALPLEEHGLEWIYPEYPLAHPLDDGPAVVFYHSMQQTASGLGRDESAYHRLFGPFISRFGELMPQLLAPFNPLPSSPLLMARFGMKALRSARSLACSLFDSERARALFAGLAGHSTLPFDKLGSAAIGLVLGLAGHVKGWPLPKGGSHQITRAMASYFKSLGGVIQTGCAVSSLDQLGSDRRILFDLTPVQVLDIAGDSIPSAYADKLRSFRYGAGVFKLDLALDGPIPWRDAQCGRAGTVHLGGTFEEISSSEKKVGDGDHSPRPYVLLAQQSLFDETRAPAGGHTAWAYCHVPNGSTVDMTDAIENQIERFAPGFKDLIIGRHKMNTEQVQTYNANYIGGDINGGRPDITQLLTRPAGLLDPYHIPDTSYYICSSSTPPGGGVHGMCGYHAARAAMKREFGINKG